MLTVRQSTLGSVISSSQAVSAPRRAKLRAESKLSLVVLPNPSSFSFEMSPVHHAARRRSRPHAMARAGFDSQPASESYRPNYVVSRRSRGLQRTPCDGHLRVWEALRRHVRSFIVTSAGLDGTFTGKHRPSCAEQPKYPVTCEEKPVMVRGCPGRGQTRLHTAQSRKDWI